jgi:hypothetical protein
MYRVNEIAYLLWQSYGYMLPLRHFPLFATVAVQGAAVEMNRFCTIQASYFTIA